MADMQDEDLLFANHPELLAEDNLIQDSTPPETNQEHSGPSADLPNSSDEADSLISRQSQEIELLRGMLDDLLAKNQSLAQGSDDESFMRNVRAMYHQDPLGATDAMLKRFQDNVFQEMEQRLSAAVNHNRRMDDTMSFSCR